MKNNGQTQMHSIQKFLKKHIFLKTQVKETIKCNGDVFGRLRMSCVMKHIQIYLKSEKYKIILIVMNNGLAKE